MSEGNIIDKQWTNADLATVLAQTQLYLQNNVISPPLLNSNDNIKEKDRIFQRMSGFDPKDNQAWREITARFGSNIKHPELLSIAEVLAKNANVKLDRDAKRRKTVLIKWFSENWVAISPFLNYVVLEDNAK